MGKLAVCVHDEGLQGKTDQEQLGFASNHGHVLVTADTKIKVRKHERAALIAADISVVEILFPQNYVLWDRFKLMVNKWERVEELLATSKYVVVRPNSVKTLAQENRR